ncbi:MAG TPA: hypothetical protein EYP29_01175 [Thermoplasmata archaeon]|nr:hypothetical protein [Thermoplasmata archaeon]
MPEEDIKEAERVEEEYEEISPLNFVKKNKTLMSIGFVRKFVDWLDNERTEPDAYLTLLLTLVFFVAIIIGIISTFVDV